MRLWALAHVECVLPAPRTCGWSLLALGDLPVRFGLDQLGQILEVGELLVGGSGGESLAVASYVGEVQVSELRV